MSFLFICLSSHNSKMARAIASNFTGITNETLECSFGILVIYNSCRVG